MMDYYEHVASLPDNLYEIYTFCWDETGRPNFEQSYQIAVGRLCAISNDWDEFSGHCKQFFFNKDERRESELSLAWHCYIKGMVVLTEKLSKES